MRWEACPGAGLPDDVEVAAALQIEHDGLARNAGADLMTVSWSERSRRAVRIAMGNMMRAAPAFP